MSTPQGKTIRRLVLAITTALACAGCASASGVSAARDACTVARQSRDAAAVSLPFEIVNGRVYTQAHVNGTGPYTFAIDTGASGFGRADASLTSALGLPISGGEQNSDGVTTAAASTVHLDRLQLGALSRNNIDVITRDYSSNLPEDARISGIIARDFFADGLLVIDFPSRSLSFSITQTLDAGDAGALAYERPFRVPVTIGDVSVLGNLDTGAGVTLVLPRALYDQVSATALESAGRARLSNTVIESSRATLAGPVRIGGATVADIEVRVAEQAPELVVGGQVLQNYLIAFDQRSHLVAVCPAPGG